MQGRGHNDASEGPCLSSARVAKVLLQLSHGVVGALVTPHATMLPCTSFAVRCSAKMMKVGLPRPVCEHKMLSEGVNPAILDMDPEAQVMADQLSPPKKGKIKQGPLRKKLHWVPIRGKVQESSIWFGPPADLVAAASQLITDEAEFNRLFVQVSKSRRSTIINSLATVACNRAHAVSNASHAHMIMSTMHHDDADTSLYFRLRAATVTAEP